MSEFHWKIGKNTMIESPMFGTIIQIFLMVGQTVKTGENICVIEAMKMQSLVRSADNGKITHMAGRVGEIINHRFEIATVFKGWETIPQESIMLNGAFLGAFFPWREDDAPMEDPTPTSPAPSPLAGINPPEETNTLSNTPEETEAPQEAHVLALGTSHRLMSPPTFLEENMVKKNDLSSLPNVPFLSFTDSLAHPPTTPHPTKMGESHIYPLNLKMPGLPRPLQGLAMTAGCVIASKAKQPMKTVPSSTISIPEGKVEGLLLRNLINFQQTGEETQKGKTNIWRGNKKTKQEFFFTSLNKLIRNPGCKEVPNGCKFSFLTWNKWLEGFMILLTLTFTYFARDFRNNRLQRKVLQRQSAFLPIIKYLHGIDFNRHTDATYQIAYNINLPPLYSLKAA